jgi:RluA family pseudouridine synthase
LWKDHFPQLFSSSYSELKLVTFLFYRYTHLKMKLKSLYSIIYEDDSITAVNKAAGITVGSDRWDESKERLDRLLDAYYAEKAEGEGEENKHRVYTVHRIDRDTSGLVVFARNSETHKALSIAFEERRVQKRYIAAVYGRPSWKEADCDLPLVPDGNKAHMTIIDKYKGKKSFTRFRVLGGAGNYTVLEVIPETGRTHQIRVHLAALGHPIVCDSLYGRSPIGKGVCLSSFKRGWRGDPLDEKPLLARLGLHAAEITLPAGFAGAADGSPILKAPLPKDMAALIKQMENAGGQKIETGLDN